MHLATLVGFAMASVLVASGFPPGTFGPSMPYLAPALFAGWAIQSVIDGRKTGRIQVMHGGFSETEYQNNPIGFLAAIMFNLFMGFMSLLASAMFIAVNFPTAP